MGDCHLLNFFPLPTLDGLSSGAAISDNFKLHSGSRDDVGQMQVVQRGMLQRIGLLIGRNRDDDRPVDLADRELVGLKPAEIECIAGSVEINVGITSPIPIDLGCRHGAPP